MPAIDEALQSQVDCLADEIEMLRTQTAELREENAALQVKLSTYYMGNPVGGVVSRLEADVAELREENAALRAENAAEIAALQMKASQCVMEDAERISRLESENAALHAALRADAERYRWLRDKATPTLCRLAHRHSGKPSGNFATPLAVIEATVRMDCDAAIDAARGVTPPAASPRR